MRILVAQDDPAVASFLKNELQAEHFAVDIAADGHEALYMAKKYHDGLLILDLNLARMDGLQVLRQIQHRRKHVPVLVLTGRSRVEDRVKALDLGADDYMIKPFAFRELIARVRALLRRGNVATDFLLQVKDLKMDRLKRTVHRGKTLIELTPKEFALLEYLMRNAGEAVSRNAIKRRMWNFSLDTASNVVDVYISYLRKKLDKGTDQKLIHTVPGIGYRIGIPR